MKHFIFILAIVFSCGIIFSHFLFFSFIAAYAGALIILALCFFLRAKKLFHLFAFVSVFMLGIVWAVNQNTRPNDYVGKFAYYAGKETCLIKGRVISQPQQNQGKLSFLFNARAIQPLNKTFICRGNILVTVHSKASFNYGEELILRGKACRAFGKSGYAAYLDKQGIRLLMSVPDAAGITRLNRNSGFIFKRFSFYIKDKIQKQLYSLLSPLCAGITDAMLLGNKKNIPFIVYKSMMKSGTVHILVVSGFNVGLVAVLADMVLKALRFKRRFRVILITAVLFCYCLITGASNPVVRATIMATVFLAAVFIKREADIYNSLGLAAILILLVNPQQVFDVGFQLSFASVLAIVFLYPKMKGRLFVEKITCKPARITAEGFLVSLAAWLGTSGLIFYYFRSISPVAVLANIFIVPLASFITLNGFALAILGSINPCLARCFAPVSELAVVILLALNAAFLKIPFAYLSLNKP